MTDIIKVICENLGTEIDVPMGTPLSEVAKRLTPGRYPFLAAFVNNRLKELSYKIYAPVTIRFVDVTSFAGIRVYQRTAWFLLQKAVRDLYPGQTLHIRHSLGHSGFYCEIEGIDEFTADDAARLQGRMRELSVRNLPITRERMLTTEVRARYAEEGFTDKVALLDTRPRLYSQLYTLGDTVGYFYGSLAPSTGYVTLFDIQPYYNGFYLALPLRTAPDTLHRNVQQEKMFGIFQEYQSWVALMGVPTIGAVNARTGRRRGHDQTRRGVPRTQIRLGRRHHLRRRRQPRHPHGAHLGPLVERQDHLGQAAGHPARRAGAAPGDDLARRLLRRS